VPHGLEVVAAVAYLLDSAEPLNGFAKVNRQTPSGVVSRKNTAAGMVPRLPKGVLVSRVVILVRDVNAEVISKVDTEVIHIDALDLADLVKKVLGLDDSKVELVEHKGQDQLLAVEVIRGKVLVETVVDVQREEDQEHQPLEEKKISDHRLQDSVVLIAALVLAAQSHKGASFPVAFFV